jgi:hypothetical protein
MSLRTEKTEAAYQQAKKSGKLQDLMSVPRLHHFKYWFLIENSFPYDLAFEVHHMLIPIREVATREELSYQEEQELKIIKEYFVEPTYDVIMDNMASKRSVLNQYHLHLGKYKQREKDTLQP